MPSVIEFLIEIIIRDTQRNERKRRSVQVARDVRTNRIFLQPPLAPQ